VIKQSPGRGDMAVTDSTVVVVINIGLRRDAVTVAHDGEASRSPARSSNLRSSERFFPHSDFGISYDAQAGRGDISDGGAATHRAHDGDAKEKSDRGKKSKKSQ
jgi:hypothetical protein